MVRRGVVPLIVAASMVFGLVVAISAGIATVRPHRADAAGTEGITLFYAVPSGDGSTVTVAGIVDAAPDADFSVEVDTAPSCDSESSPFGVPNFDVTTNDDGYAYFADTFATSGYVPSYLSLVSYSPNFAASNCYPVGPDNTGWENAEDVPLLSGEGSASGLVALPGESRWYKVAVTPDTKVSVTLSGLSDDYAVAVYSDIGQTDPSLAGGATALDALSAESASDTFSPSAFIPSAFIPSAFIPSAFIPSAFIPSAFIPSAFIPSAFDPSAFDPSTSSPTALDPSSFDPSALAPDALSPSSYSTTEDIPAAFTAASILPSAFDPRTYSSTVDQSLITYDDQDGLADKSVTVDTYQSTGSLYIRVAGNNGANDDDNSFQLSVNSGGGACNPDVLPIGTAPAPAPGTGVRTVIVTDSSRLDGSAAAISDMMSELQTLAARPEVDGVVVDLASNSRVQALNAQADADPTCVYAKNLVAGAIQDVVNSYRADNPLKYVVIAGPDNVIPFFRHPDQTLLGNETGYSPPLANDSPSDAALRLGYTLSDNDYGAETELVTSTDTVPVPDLAVGRLVETASEISGMVQAYLGTDGGVLPQPSSSLVTGYDFLSLPAESVEADLAAGTGQTPQTLIEPQDESPASGWNATQLEDEVLDSGRHDIIFLAGHFSANDTLAADYQTDMITTDMEDSDVDLKNALVFTPGCHSGYNIVASDAVPNVTLTLDWPEEMARKQAIFIGGTGYQYGDTDFIAYSEQIYADFAHQLRLGTGPVSIGEALLDAKQDYLTNTPDIDAIGQKAVYEATLYGLPMSSIDMPDGRIAAPSDASIVSTTTPATADPGSALGLSSTDITVTPDLTPHTVTVDDLTNGDDPVGASYLSGDDGVAVNAYQPVLPLESDNVSVPGQSLRGALFLGGSYSDTTGVTPLTGAPATEIRGVHTGFQSDVFFPEKPWSINYFDALDGHGTGATRLLVEPAQHRSDTTPGATTDTRRQYSSMQFRLFYSADTTTYGSGATASTPALAGAPDIVEVQSTLSPDGTSADICVTVGGDPTAGVQNAVVTYTDPTAADPSWQSQDLVQGSCNTEDSWGDINPTDSASWGGSISLADLNADSLEFMIQAVNGAGDVSLDDNLGQYFSLPQQPTSSSGSIVQDVQASTTSTPYGTSETVSATADAYYANADPGYQVGPPLVGEPVTFTIGNQSVTALTDDNGNAQATLPVDVPPGRYTLDAALTPTDGTTPSSADDPTLITVTQQPTLLSLSSPTVGPDTTTEATLCSATTDQTCGPDDPPVANQTVVFELAGPVDRVTALQTNSAGQVLYNAYGLPPGAYQLSAYFDGSIPGVGSFADPAYGSSSASVAIGTDTAYTTAPSLQLPADITTAATGPEGAVVSWVASATDPVDPRPDVSCTPGSVTLFPVGTTTVDCSATDEAGNSSSGSFTVTVTPFVSALDPTTTVCNGTYDGTGAVVTVPRGAVCRLTSGTRVTGSITVAPGGTLDAQGVAVTGAVRLNGALPSLLCGMTIGRTLTVERSPASIAPTVIGDTTRGCSAGDSIAGQTLLTGNRGPVDFSSNTTGTGTGTGTGTVTVTADSGTTAIDDDHIGRDLVIALNTRSVTVGGNRIAHDLVATQNASGLTLRGNLVTGAISVLSNVKTAVVTTDTAGTTMTVSDNTGAVKVVGNHAAGALTVQGNEPGGATVTDNSAGQDATCSDNHPMRGGGNSAGGVLSCPG